MLGMVMRIAAEKFWIAMERCVCGDSSSVSSVVARSPTSFVWKNLIAIPSSVAMWTNSGRFEETIGTPYAQAR